MRRDHRGKFAKGSSGNPTGQAAWQVSARRRLQKELSEAGPDAMEVLRKALHSDDEKLAVVAAQYVVNKVDGKPTQRQERDIDIHGQVEHKVDFADAYVNALKQLTRS